MDAGSRTVVVKVASAVHGALKGVVLPPEDVVAVRGETDVSFTFCETVRVVDEAGETGGSVDGSLGRLGLRGKGGAERMDSGKQATRNLLEPLRGR